MSLNRLAREIHADNVGKGFWEKPRNVGELLMLVVSELGEGIEAHRKDNFANLEQYIEDTKGNDRIDPEAFKKHIKDTFEDELADAIIRLLDMCYGLNIDIEFHVSEKLKYNRTRGYKHNKSY